MTTAYADRLSQQLDALAVAGRRRVTRPVTLLEGARVVRDGRVLVNVSSNDYLGLSRHAALIARAREWGERMGVGATASRLVCGTLDAHAAVEDKLAAFKGTEAAPDPQRPLSGQRCHPVRPAGARGRRSGAAGFR